ncbi:MAG: peptidase, partial [Solobacterium sp.]|nr:peptidase [Solobacterium sp.]
MKKIELLAPAGNPEALKAAVSAGCDAVYLGLTSFSARAFAGNFTHEQYLEAIRYCHIRDV